MRATLTAAALSFVASAFRRTSGPNAVLAAAVICFTSVVLAAAGPAEMLYADAVAKERAVRTALADVDQTASAITKAARTVVADFQAVVRRYPASPYCDDALWHGGRLALDVFDKYGETRDRES